MEIKHIKEDCTFELVIDNTRAFVTYEIYDGDRIRISARL